MAFGNWYNHKHGDDVTVNVTDSPYVVHILADGIRVEFWHATPSGEDYASEEVFLTWGQLAAQAAVIAAERARP